MFNKFINLRKKSPGTFYSIIIGAIVGLIISICIFNSIIKCSKKSSRKGYISQVDSDVAGSNRISASY